MKQFDEFIEKYLPMDMRFGTDDKAKFSAKMKSDLIELMKEVFDKGWTSAWHEENERTIADLSYRDREFKTHEDYWQEFLTQITQQSGNPIFTDFYY